MNDFVEEQYNIFDKFSEKYGLACLGKMGSFTWNNDPKRLVFSLARYKHIGALLEGEDRVLEIGCGDSFGSRIVKQYVSHLTVTDIDKLMINEALKQSREPFKYDCIVHNFIDGPLIGKNKFSAAYLLDVLEHIKRDDQFKFFDHIKQSLENRIKGNCWYAIT